MFESLIGHKVVITLRSNSKVMFGLLVYEKKDSIQLKLDDNTPFIINKADISSSRPYEEREKNDY